jgi:hypothetical protein
MELMRMVGTEKEGAAEGRRELHHEKLHNFYSSRI